MSIAAKNGFLAGKRGTPPPVPGARWVEWLYGFNGPYIRTGVYSNTDLAMEVVAKFDWSKISSESTFGSYIGCNEAGSGGTISAGFTADQQSLVANFSSSTGRQRVDVPINSQFNTFFCSKNVSRINDTESTVSGTPTILTSREVYLFMNNTNWGGNSRPSCYIKSARFWQNSTLIRDFAPIAIDTTGYMLDLVSGEYLQYGNKGTGDFVIGPDI